MHLVIGLGNPGVKYQKSRHNAGFIVLGQICGRFESDKYGQAQICRENDVIFAKPETFMNSSGLSAKYISEKENIPTENIIIVHDDIDMPFGAMKIVFESGAGGHNGVQSIIDNLGTNEFLRIKIGIAPTDVTGKAIKPKPGFFQSQRSAVSKYVLKDFGSVDLEKLQNLAPKVREIIETISREGKDMAMNRFN